MARRGAEGRPLSSPTRRTHVPAVNDCRNEPSTEVAPESSPRTRPSQVRRLNRRFPAAPRNRGGSRPHQGRRPRQPKDPSPGASSHMRRLRGRRRAPPRSPTRRTHVPAVVGFSNRTSTEVDRKSCRGTDASQVRRLNRRFPAAPRNRGGSPNHQEQRPRQPKDPSPGASSHMRRLRGRRRAPPRSPTRRTHVPAVVGFSNRTSTEVDRESCRRTQASQVRRWNRRFSAAPRNRGGSSTHQGSATVDERSEPEWPEPEWRDPMRTLSSPPHGRLRRRS